LATAVLVVLGTWTIAAWLWCVDGDENETTKKGRRR